MLEKVVQHMRDYMEMEEVEQGYRKAKHYDNEVFFVYEPLDASWLHSYKTEVMTEGEAQKKINEFKEHGFIYIDEQKVYVKEVYMTQMQEGYKLTAFERDQKHKEMKMERMRENILRQTRETMSEYIGQPYNAETYRRMQEDLNRSYTSHWSDDVEASFHNAHRGEGVHFHVNPHGSGNAEEIDAGDVGHVSSHMQEIIQQISRNRAWYQEASPTVQRVGEMNNVQMVDAETGETLFEAESMPMSYSIERAEHPSLSYEDLRAPTDGLPRITEDDEEEE